MKGTPQPACMLTKLLCRHLLMKCTQLYHSLPGCTLHESPGPSAPQATPPPQPRAPPPADQQVLQGRLPWWVVPDGLLLVGLHEHHACLQLQTPARALGA